MNGNDYQVCLASQSPRRRELLAQIGVRFLILSAAIDEVRRDGEEATAFVQRMAREKAGAGLARPDRGSLPVLGADTVVVLGGAVLGKPRDRAHGIDMLRRLSGREHRVITAVSVMTSARRVDRLQISRVRLATLNRSLIEAYWETGEPQDKAGAYAIQGRGGAFVEHLDGSYSGVMGLPLFETLAALTEVGIVAGAEDLMK